MRLEYYSIKMRLFLGFAALTLVMAVLGVMGLRELKSSRDVTTSMYRHPLTVSNAVRDIRSSILAMHRNMKDVVLARDGDHLVALAALVDEDERLVIQRYGVVHERFLGDKTHVENARRAFIAWRAIRDQVFALVREGRIEEAVEITRGEGAAHVDLLHDLNTVMSDFASSKAIEFYDESARVERRAFRTHAIILTGLVLMSVVFAIVIARSITTPLGQVIDGIEPLARGRFGHRIGLDRRDEVGRLAETIDAMADELVTSTTTIDALNAQVAARRKAEERATTLGRIVESSLNEILMIDTETLRIVEANRGAMTNLGYSLDALETMTPLDIDRDRDEAAFRSLVCP